MSLVIAISNSQHFIVHEVVTKSSGLAMFHSWLVKTKHTLLFRLLKDGDLISSFHKKKEFDEKNERRPLVGTVRRLGNTPFPTQRIGSIRHQASCRHLRYIECFLTPITHHRRSYGSTHSTKGALLHPQRKSSVLIDIEDKTYMRFHTAQHYNWAWITH